MKKGICSGQHPLHPIYVYNSILGDRWFQYVGGKGFGRNEKKKKKHLSFFACFGPFLLFFFALVLPTLLSIDLSMRMLFCFYSGGSLPFFVCVCVCYLGASACF